MNGLHDYLLGLIEEKRERIFLDMEEYAKENEFPIIGPLVGNFLMQYAILSRADRILELGSGFGYSALWFAKANPKEIICTDSSEEKKNMALDFFKRSGTKNIKFIVGDALEILDQLKGDFNIIFCDIDKEDYPLAFQRSIPRLKKGGLLLTDNTLWYGRILESKPDRTSTKGVKEYNKLIFSDSRVISTIIPIRDGLSVSLKL